VLGLGSCHHHGQLLQASLHTTPAVLTPPPPSLQRLCPRARRCATRVWARPSSGTLIPWCGSRTRRRSWCRPSRRCGWTTHLSSLRRPCTSRCGWGVGRVFGARVVWLPATSVLARLHPHRLTHVHVHAHAHARSHTTGGPVARGRQPAALQHQLPPRARRVVPPAPVPAGVTGRAGGELRGRHTHQVGLAADGTCTAACMHTVHSG
jgi:hypothetical protein